MDKKKVTDSMHSDLGLCAFPQSNGSELKIVDVGLAGCEDNGKGHQSWSGMEICCTIYNQVGAFEGYSLGIEIGDEVRDSENATGSNQFFLGELVLEKYD